MKNAPKEPLIETAKAAYPKLRQLSVFLLVGGLAAAPLVPSPAYRTGVLMALGITLLFLLFDIYNQLHARLSTIEECVLVPRPVHYDDFRGAEDAMYKTIESALIEAPGVDLHFLTVSGNYSWPFFEDAVRRLDAKFEGRKKLVVTFCLVDPNHFDRWALLNWKRKAEVTLGSIAAFKRRYAARIEQQSIIVHTHLFDNIPHWHGVLVAGSTLFLGRTEWEIPSDGSDAPPELLVGQIEYRKFTANDRFGGDKRITRFKNWIERYKLRGRELSENWALPRDLAGGQQHFTIATITPLGGSTTNGVHPARENPRVGPGG